MYLFLSIPKVEVGMEDKFYKNIENLHLFITNADLLISMPVICIFASKKIFILHK